MKYAKQIHMHALRDIHSTKNAKRSKQNNFIHLHVECKLLISLFFIYFFLGCLVRKRVIRMVYDEEFFDEIAEHSHCNGIGYNFNSVYKMCYILYIWL